jgi:F-type H+-transporting ATPase subunit a
VNLTITPDTIVYWSWGPVKLNATIVFSWLVMALLVVGSWLITRNLSVEVEISRWQSLLEVLVLTIRDQIRDVTNQNPDRYLPFIGTLFLFISLSNLLVIVPGYHAPTSSLSTTLALAICVFFAVPIFGIMQRGVIDYFRHYIEPSPILLPFHITSELSRTFALAVRLFGNVVSGSIIVGILLSIIPIFLPVVLEAFELLIGQIQAYIFAILALVYIASAARAHRETQKPGAEGQKSE